MVNAWRTYTGLMGQAAIQAGVPVDVRLETPSHLSFQASCLLCLYHNLLLLILLFEPFSAVHFLPLPS